MDQKIMDHWFIHPADVEARSRLSKALGLEPITSQILINRGFKDAQSAGKFLEPDIRDLPDPFFLPDMGRAIQRIIAAIEKKEKIALYGDYDVDGITGVAILRRFFRSIGVEPAVFIPNRLSHGYGLSRQALEILKKEGVELVITVDCGTKSKAEIEFALGNGIDIIVTDHHEVDQDFANYIHLNPKRPDIDCVHREIAGCGVAFFLLLGLKNALRQEYNVEEQLDLVALGTIADVVPLTGINRIFAKFGMRAALKSSKPGLKSLINISGLKGGELKTGTVAFRIAPRINAAGRMGDAYPSLELLTTDDAKVADEIAQTLNKLNQDRQRIEEKTLAEAISIIEQTGLARAAAIVVGNKKWHPGVIGIVASKLVDAYSLPAVVISSPDKKSRGSARSIPGLNIVDALTRCSDVLERFGGHAQAAGLTVDTDRIDLFRSRFETSCAELAPPVRQKRVTIDAEVEAPDITTRLAKELELLEPFGLGNPEPLLLARNLAVARTRIVGTNHLKMRLMSQDKKSAFDAIGFDLGKKSPAVGQNISIVFTPQINEWNGFESLQLKIKEISCLLSP